MKNYGAKESWTRLFCIERDPFYFNWLVCPRNDENFTTVDDENLILYDPVNERAISFLGLPALGLPTGQFMMTAYVKSILSIASLMRSTTNKGVKAKKRRRVQQTAH
ncbi:hypothetical protein AQUCO_00901053v1 [Aquilegia coerulea]|uniref:F-box associated domain-containing protein n=1 Tax=Aquilegia coerulea TaxID=218851 RepID=A0A2G5EGI9_AQUCA|nr:hypothetical protein AQUCO_00901053v1 [Aquilegia coerulea]